MSPDPGGTRRTKPAILVVTSQVVRGAIGGRAAIFSLERLGYRVWFLPTVLLPWHPGHGVSSRLVADEQVFASLVDDLANAPWLGEIGAILTGYLGNSAQAPLIAALITAIRQANPDTFYLCDPVIGDGAAGEGALYVPPDTACAIRDHLLPLSDMATPNAFELAWLSGKPVSSEHECIEAARGLGMPDILVTSAPALMRNSIATMLISEKHAITAEHRALPAAPHGTGDLIAALALAGHVGGLEREALLRQVTASTFDIARESLAAGSDELLLAQVQEALIRPQANITLRRIGEKRRD